MNITFLVDHQSYRTGNSAYKRGDEVTFDRHGVWLVVNGVAKEGWGHTLKPVAKEAKETFSSGSISSMSPGLTVTELKKWAKAADIPGYSTMKKAELIEALS